ncbi:MAG TPA: hypothetical protein VGS02_04600 [Acidobacteriaceae bacterium]|nr:hypothetical protein [Acidobacteriaceae bacterium]
MSRQFQLYLLPAEVEWLVSQLRSKFDLRLLQEHSPTSKSVELDSPLRCCSATPKWNAHTDVRCYIAKATGADVRMWYASKRAEWLLADESEVIEFSGCKFDGTSLADGRFYLQTEKLVGDAIIPKRPEFLTWADRVFRTTKRLLFRSEALHAYLGPATVQWWRDGGQLVSLISRKPAYGSEIPDI